jgi:hypothetical protein
MIDNKLKLTLFQGERLNNLTFFLIVVKTMRERDENTFICLSSLLLTRSGEKE